MQMQKKKKKTVTQQQFKKNIIKSQIYIMYYVYIVRKHNDKFENKITSQKTQGQI